MSELSELYAVDTSFSSGLGGGTCTYKWADYSNPTEYIQDYADTGEETIDPTIFTFRYPKDDPYVMGNYFTQITQGTAQEIGIYVAQNQFKKIVSTPAHNMLANPYAITNNDNRVQLVKYGKYDVATPSDYFIDALQRFYVDFDYGRLLLIPKIAGWKYNDNQNVTPVGNGGLMYIDNFLQDVYASSHQHYLITSASYEIKYANSSPGTTFNPMYIQFKGTLKDLSYTRDSWGYSNIVDNGYVDGVFLTPATLSLFSCPSYTNAGKPSFGMYISPYDLTQICLVYIAPNTARYMGVADVNIIYNLMDRLGFYWSKNPNSDCDTLGALCNDPDVRCPVIDRSSGNLVTDTVLSGEDIADYVANNPDSNLAIGYAGEDHAGITWEEIRETARPQEPTLDETDEVNLDPPVISTMGGNHMWLMSNIEVNELYTYLWDPTGNEFQNIIHGLALLGENPMDFIVSLRMFPIKNLLSYVEYATGTICFGRYTSPMTSKMYMTSSNVLILDLGSFYFNDGGLQNDFRDYEPYTQYSIFIPFCGIISLTASECINQTISIKMIVDLATGACTAVVYTDKVPYKYVDSIIGIEVPVSGRDMARFSQTVMAAALGGGIGGGKVAAPKVKSMMADRGAEMTMARAERSIGASGVADGIGNGAGEGISHYAAAGEHMSAAGGLGAASVALGASALIGGAALAGTAAGLTSAPELSTVGSSTPAAALAEPMYCYFIIQRTECWIPDNYEKLYGRPLNEGGKVGDFSGYSVFGNIRADNIANATPEEVKLIVDLLISGVYL